MQDNVLHLRTSNAESLEPSCHFVPVNPPIYNVRVDSDTFRCTSVREHVGSVARHFTCRPSPTCTRPSHLPPYQSVARGTSARGGRCVQPRDAHRLEVELPLQRQRHPADPRQQPGQAGDDRGRIQHAQLHKGFSKYDDLYALVNAIAHDFF